MLCPEPHGAPLTCTSLPWSQAINLSKRMSYCWCLLLLAWADDATELSGFTPAFLWLLRDFYLDLEEDGRKVQNTNAASWMQPPACSSHMLSIHLSHCTSGASRMPAASSSIHQSPGSKAAASTSPHAFGVWPCSYPVLNQHHCLQVSPREYLETALSPAAGSGAGVEAKNQVGLRPRLYKSSCIVQGGNSSCTLSALLHAAG